MKLNVLSMGLPVLAQLASAIPTPTVEENAPNHIQKRAAITDVYTKLNIWFQLTEPS